MPTVNDRLSSTFHMLSTNTYGGVDYHTDAAYVLETAHVYRSWSRQSRPYILTLPYVSQKVSYVPKGYYIEELGPPDSRRTGWVGANLDYLLGLASSQDDDVPLANAMNGAIDNIKGASWNFPVFAAEAHKTMDSVHLLAQKATKGWSYFRKLRRNPKQLLQAVTSLWYHSPKDVKRNAYYKRVDTRFGTDDAAKAWLRYRYEVMTGIMDVQDAAKTTADLLLAQPEVHKSAVRRTIAVELPVHSVGYGTPGAPYLLGIHAGANLAFVRRASAEITCKAWISTRRDNPVISEANQLGLLNWPANIWELLPGSFIADWSLDIGNYLERLPALCGLVIVDSGFSTYRRVGGTISASVGSDYYTTRYLELEPLEFEASSYQRSPWVNPTPVWTPAIRLSTNRLIDAAALFRTLGTPSFQRKLRI